MKGKRGHKNKKDKNKAPPPAPPLPASGDDKADVAQSGSKVKLKLITPKPIESQTDTNQSSPPMLSVADTAKPSLKPHKQELDTALHIIKKVMKMDAAEPFNVPVNPEALGIPDYFDVIDTPMDFGTICSNLEMGVKYNSSEDVYRDVQYIWDNCYKYNNKGDYIVDLMKRVKKNFAKYWTTAGLYSGPATGVESSQDNGSPSDQMKLHIKGAQLKPKGKKLHGRRHKSDCLCAICVLKRRRREREANEANAQMVKSPLGATDSNLSQEFRQEESSHAESPGEDSSSDMDGSLDPNADAKVEETEDAKTGLSKQRFGSLLKEKQEEEEDDDEEDEEESETEGDDEGLHQVSKSREEPNIPSQPISAKLDAGILTYSKRKASGQHEERIEAENQEKEVQEIQKKAKLSKNLQFENPMLVDLCGILFPNNNKSIWNGPHSLAQRHTSHNSSIHAAIDMLMK